MRVFFTLIILFVIFVLVETYLSLRNNHLLGLIVPWINILIATGLGMMGSDYFTGYLVYFAFLIPLPLWLMIYKLCRNRVRKKKEKDMKTLKVREL